jgi:outer membrane protein
MISKNVVVLALCGGCCLPAQGPTQQELPLPPNAVGAAPGLLQRYQPRQAAAISFTDSPRLNALIRAGSLYLSLREAVALAIENNLDVELTRITPLIAESDLLRAKAGGTARGVPTTVREGPAGLGSSSQGITATGGLQTSVSASDATANSTVSAVNPSVTSSGPAVPMLDPSLVGSIGWNKTNHPQTATFITGTSELTTTSLPGSFGLQKGFLSGGMASVGYDTLRQNTNNLRSDINPNTTGGISLNISQPLLNGFGVAVNNRYIRIAKNNRQVSDLVFEQQLITTGYAVTRLYWDLVSLNSQAKVAEQSVALAQRLLDENQQQEQTGTLASIEVVRAKAEVARAQRDLTVANARVRQQETILKDYLTRQTVDSAVVERLRIVPTDTIPVPTTDATQPLPDLIGAAQKRRPDYAQAVIQVDSSRISLDGSRNALKPSLNVVASARTNTLYGPVNAIPPVTPGTVRTPSGNLVGGLGTGLDQIFTGRYPDYGVALQLNIPLSNRAAQADYSRDQLSLRQQQIRLQQVEKQLRVDVSNALIAVEQSRAAWEAARQAREFQTQSLDAEQQKYAVGASTNYLVIQYQRDLAQAQSIEVAALADYATAQAALDRATGMSLERLDISVADAYRGTLH